MIELPFDPRLRPGGVIDIDNEISRTTRRRLIEIAAAIAEHFVATTTGQVSGDDHYATGCLAQLVWPPRREQTADWTRLDTGRCYHSGWVVSQLLVFLDGQYRNGLIGTEVGYDTTNWRRRSPMRWTSSSVMLGLASCIANAVVISDWKHDYNYHRWHSSLGYQPPARYAATCTHQ